MSIVIDRFFALFASDLVLAAAAVEEEEGEVGVGVEVGEDEPPGSMLLPPSSSLESSRVKMLLAPLSMSVSGGLSTVHRHQ